MISINTDITIKVDSIYLSAISAKGTQTLKQEKKGRDLTQSYDKSPHTEMSKGQSDNANNATTKVRLHIDCGPT